MEIRFEAGILTLTVFVKNGIIEEFKISGDFFEVKPIEELENIFLGKKFDKEEMESLLYNIKIEDYIHLLSNSDFKKLFF